MNCCDSFLRKAAGALADSPLLRCGKNLFVQNARDWNLPLSKFDKLCAGFWVILNDYAKGVFPPEFPSRDIAYQSEKDYRFSVPGMTPEQVLRNDMTKPFWWGKAGLDYLRHFSRLAQCLEQTGTKPPAKILELGCGGGWMSEFLATAGFAVCGTTLDESEAAVGQQRAKSLESKGLSPVLRFVATPMESVHQAVAGEEFDAVFVFEALHHAYDWREAIRSTFTCLKPGGWFLICNEPNVLHTCVAYRVAKLSNTHEIGFRKRDLTVELRKTGFRKIVSVGPKLHCWFRSHWLLAQK